ncbi:hypothetical protein HPB49_008650 [Dermacentor silvarum]|uniref:Uncharacterized protein n=1 Tax=Dermacentor silvarum TaxID=543639 RepID=A0ACB8D440_DERSI|nr:hypothetical protein HPB49_008650 [Dermacentor silvarum]
MTSVQKKLVKSKSGLRIVTVGNEELSPFHLDEPPWTPDREASVQRSRTADCWRCRSKFDFITRRHHCRRCGRVYCSSCCSRRLPLQRMCFVDPVRICHDCSPATLRENDFYDRHLRLLLAGAHFLVTVVPDTNAALPHCCRLSLDHRILELENAQSKECIEIPLANICTYRILRPNSPGITDSTVTDSLVYYEDTGGFLYPSARFLNILLGLKNYIKVFHPLLRPVLNAGSSRKHNTLLPSR